MVSQRRLWGFPYAGSCRLQKRDTFSSSSQNRMPPISFPRLIALARSSTATVKKSGESGHPGLVPDFRGEAFHFPPFSLMLAGGLSHTAFSPFRWYIPSRPTLWSVSNINWRQISSDAFSAPLDRSLWLLSFALWMWCIPFTEVRVSKHPCCPWVESHLWP